MTVVEDGYMTQSSSMMMINCDEIEDPKFKKEDGIYFQMM
jgi:hypothetical protein